MGKKFSLALMCFLCWGFFGSVQAEEKSSAQEWEPVSAGPGTTWTAPLCGKGKFVVQPFVNYNRTRGSFNADGHYDKLPDGDKKSQYQQQLFAQYGVTDKFELDLQGVYQENFIKQSGETARFRGFADSYLYARYGLLENESSGFGLTAISQLKIPTGRYQHARADKLGTDMMGNGSWDHGYGLLLTQEMKPFVFHLDSIYSFPEKVRVDGDKTVYGNYWNYDAAVEYFLPRGFNLMMELNGLVQADTKVNGERTPSSGARSLVFSPGIGWSNAKIQTLIAYQRTIAGDNNVDANDSVMATFVYTF